MPEPATVIYPAFEGPCLDIFGLKHWILTDGSDNGQAYSVVAAQCEPGQMIPPHSHPTTDEFFVILSGTYEFWLEGQWQKLEGPQYIHCEKSVVHGFRNVGESTGRLIATYTPAGFEQILVEMDQLNQQGRFTMEEIEKLGAAYQVINVPPEEWKYWAA